MSKQEDLKKMDELLRKKIIKCLENGGDVKELGDLNVAVSYLAKNNVIADKAKSTIEEDHKKRLEEAKKRRNI